MPVPNWKMADHPRSSNPSGMFACETGLERYSTSLPIRLWFRPMIGSDRKRIAGETDLAHHVLLSYPLGFDPIKPDAQLDCFPVFRVVPGPEVEHG